MAAITMNFSTVSTLLAQSTAASFVLGGVYAFLTEGPILVSGTACVINAIFIDIIDLLIIHLHSKRHIASNTALLLSCSSHILSTTALIAAGIAYGIIGPVGIGILIVATIHNLNSVVNIFG